MSILGLVYNQMQNNMNDKIQAQINAISATRGNNYVIMSCDSNGNMSMAANPVVHYASASARAECARLAKINPGKLFVYAKLAGGEMVPFSNTISI